MAYYPSPPAPEPPATGKASLRPAGVLLSLTALILATLALFFHASGADLIVPVLIGLFSLRLFFLWLGANKVEGATRASDIAQPMPVLAPTGQQYISNGPHTPTPMMPQPLSSVAGQVGVQRLPFPQSARSAQSTQYPQPVEVYAQSPLHTPRPYFTPAVAYTQAAISPSAEEYRQPLQSSRSSQPYIPITEDEMFQLDRPGADECCFLLAKEGEPLVECQDRYAINSASRCYAVADGVAGSFVPGPWARTIAQRFVARGGEFADKDDFQNWLADCSDRWHMWMEERWVPTMNALRERNGDPSGDWNNDIRQGAQTTLIGCSLHRSNAINDTSTRVHVFAIGDSEFFRFSPTPYGGWQLDETFPFHDPAEFNARPDTLATVPREDLLERAWLRRKTLLINAYPGDRLVLASDTLAKWLLAQVQQGNAGRWIPLITCVNAIEFEQRIRQEFYSDRVDDDDVAMLIIPIA